MTKLQSALLATATFALGAAAVQTLHAASTPAGITVSEINVKDEAAYKEWLPEIQKTIKQAGGEYIAGGCAAAMMRPARLCEAICSPILKRQTDFSEMLAARFITKGIGDFVKARNKKA